MNSVDGVENKIACEVCFCRLAEWDEMLMETALGWIGVCRECERKMVEGRTG